MTSQVPNLYCLVLLFSVLVIVLYSTEYYCRNIGICKSVEIYINVTFNYIQTQRVAGFVSDVGCGHLLSSHRVWDAMMNTNMF